jgi:hypothetical protein
MSRAGKVAGKPALVPPKHRSAKAAGGEKQPGTVIVRSQLHLGEKTVQRLGVHCSLVGRNASRVADEILDSWLSRYGKGREIFGPPDPAAPGQSGQSGSDQGGSPAPGQPDLPADADNEDRQESGAGISEESSDAA